MSEIMTAEDVADIVACENTTSPSMEWDTAALALAESHEELRRRLSMASVLHLTDVRIIFEVSDEEGKRLGFWRAFDTDRQEALTSDGAWDSLSDDEETDPRHLAAFASQDAAYDALSKAP